MMCRPEAESTMPLISPTFRAKVASSKGFCISPGPKKPRSPPWAWEPQSLSCSATSEKESGAATTRALMPSRIFLASSLLRVMLDSFQLRRRVRRGKKR